MYRIVLAFATLEQHLRAVISTPHSYRPDRCPHCGRGNLWGHGFYDRKADHSSHAELNPVPVPRFRCASCNRTCSRLPLCIGPRRWYAWALQQLVLSLMLFGLSLRCTAAVTGLSRHTVRRWWAWLRERTEDFAFHLRSRFAELGRTADTTAFWRACFASMPLCMAMAWLDRDGLTVP
jgi:transposase-like protein